MKPSFETTQDHHAPPFESSGSTRHTLAHRYGFEPQEIDAFEQQAEVMQSHVRVVVRTPLSALEGIIREGRLQAASETHTSNGLTGGTGSQLHRFDEYIAMRQELESRELQWNEGEPPIIYGFLGYDAALEDNNIQLPVYGRVELQLGEDTTERSSFTIGDSLREGFSGRSLELLGRHDATVVQQALEHSRQQPDHALNQVPYIEAQVRGGVSLQDIESAVITIKPLDIDQQLVDSLHALHAHAPDCTIVVNLDYTDAQNLPIDTIRTLPFVEFRPVVVSNGEPIAIQRNSPHYRSSSAESIERQHQRDQERLSALGGKFLRYFHAHERPENFKDPSPGYFRDGDRFPPGS